MTLWVNKSEKEAFHKLGGELGGRIEFSAATVVKADKFVGLLAVVDVATDVKSSKEQPSFEPGMICLIKFITESHETDYQGNKKKVEATTKTKWLAEQLLAQPQYFKGGIDLGVSDQTIENIVNKTNKAGKALSDELVQELVDGILELSEQTEPEAYAKLAAIDTSAIGKAGTFNRTSKPAQTEAERLKERFDFLKTIMGDFASTSNDIVSINTLISSIQDKSEALNLMELIKVVMG